MASNLAIRTALAAITDAADVAMVEPVVFFAVTFTRSAMRRSAWPMP